MQKEREAKPLSFVLVPVSVCGARCAPCPRWGCVAHRPRHNYAPLLHLPPAAQGCLGQTLTSGSSPTGNKNMGYPNGVSHILVPVAGLEPARCRQRWILSPLRLPFHHTGRCVLYLTSHRWRFYYCGRRWRQMSPTIAVPDDRLGVDTFVARRPRHLLRPRFICRRQRSGSQR